MHYNQDGKSRTSRTSCPNSDGGGWDFTNFADKVSYLVMQFPLGAADRLRNDRT
jgi:hypothetical protein